jgi:cation diffusion facilitator CzcD-associated flavoprotein CzcO
MTVCTPTDCPEVTPEHIKAMHEKYLAERDRRIKKNHNDQYIPASGKWKDIYEVDPYTAVAERAPITGETDVVILGAGYCGMMVAAQLKKAGITDFYNIDHGGNFGGTWYWNRYPGLQCDNDSLVYMPLLEETDYMPSKKFADGYEIYDHCQIIADTFSLRDNALFHTLIKSLKWNAETNRWHVHTNRGDDIKARFVVLAMGPLNKPKLPGIPGINDFKGKIFHTARWDYDYTGGEWRNPVLDKLGDKKVAIIGTGATAIQVVPYLAKHAAQTYVIQRTPSTIDMRNNRPIDADWFKSQKPGWQQERIRNFHRFVFDMPERGEPDMIEDIWTEINRNICAEREAEGWPDLTPEEYGARRDVMDYRVMERLRNRCDVVKDPVTAEALKPYYRFLCKRPASNDNFYPAFNQSNVTLIDVAETQGVERLTEKGFVHNGVEHEIDCLILASGYEVTSDLERRWGIDSIEGEGGLSIYDYWREGFQTFQGMTAHNFPNMFFTGFTQASANASNSKTFVDQGFHIGYIASQALSRGAVRLEPSAEAQDAYIQHLRAIAVDNSTYVTECTPSYFNNEGDETKKRHIFGEPWGEGYYPFEDMLARWRDEGSLQGLVLTQENAVEPAE